MKEKISIHCYICGKVQGVFFRASAKEEADLLGITGFARNLSDGRVEVIASGEREKLIKFHTWLKQGPPFAHVQDITYEELPWQTFERFDTL
jgi:acylphosphatase